MTVIEEPARPAALGVSMRAHLPAGPRRELLLLALGIDAARGADELAAGAAHGPAASRPTWATRCAPPGRSPGSATRMLHDPLHLFDANAFYPHPLSLAFSDSLLGYGPAGFFGSGTVAALVRYNLLFLFAWSLCFVGAYLLGARARPAHARRAAAAARLRLRALPRHRGRPPARDLLRRHPAGAVPAAARLPARARPGCVFAGWLVSAWQISLGFTLGLQFATCWPCSAVIVAVRLVAAAADPAPLARAGRRHGGWGSRCSSAPSASTRRVPTWRCPTTHPTARAHASSKSALLGSAQAFLAASAENRSGAVPPPARAQQRALQERELAVPRRRRSWCWRCWASRRRSTRADCEWASASACWSARCCARPRASPAAAPLPAAVRLRAGLGRRARARPDRSRSPRWFWRCSPARGRSASCGRCAGASSRWRRGGALPLVVLAEGSSDAGEAVRRAAGAEGADRPCPDRSSTSRPPLDDRVWQYYSVRASRRSPTATARSTCPADRRPRGGCACFPSRGRSREAALLGIRTVVLHTDLDRCRSPPPETTPGAAPTRVQAAAKPVAGFGVNHARAGSGHLRDPAEAMSGRRAGIAAARVRSALGGGDRSCRPSPGTRPRTTTWSARSRTARTHIDRYAAETGDKAFYKRPLVLRTGARAWRCSRCPSTARSPRSCAGARAPREGRARGGRDDLT